MQTYMKYDVDQIIFSHSNLEDPLTPGNTSHMQFWLDYVNVRNKLWSESLLVE